MKTTISSKGQIVLPSELRREDAIEAGEAFEIERIDRREYRLRRATPPNHGLLEWLEQCPQRGFFVPVETKVPESV